ncbi:hypothetical protein EGM51_13485 [Verrucomicrobia bacterium S94]|nr:hypothetical protein EGM51_13485 [Verrucomicrobia bacterium S94]
MKNRRQKRVIQPIDPSGSPEVTARNIQTPERELPGHPILVAILVTGLLIAVLGVTLSNIEITTASVGSWNLFG